MSTRPTMTSAGGADHGLGAELAPRKDDHRATSNLVTVVSARGCGVAGASRRPPGPCRPVRDPPCRAARPSTTDRGRGRRTRTSSVLWRSVWLSSITCWSLGRDVDVAARPDQPMVGREQVVDLARHLDPRRHQHDQVVADPLQVGDQVRGQDDADPLLGHDLHQGLEELAPGERVEAGHRLVEDAGIRAAWPRRG